MSANPLDDFPKIRQGFYYGQFVVAGAITLVGIGFAAAGEALPKWYVVTSTVTQALWSYLGLTAGRNVPSAKDVMEGQAPPPNPEGGYAHVPTALLVAILGLVAVVVLWVLIPH